MKQNKYDKDGSAFALGYNAEKGFKSIMESNGWTVQEAKASQDMFEHWDFMLTKEDKKLLVDVKSEKKINRGDAQTQDEWIWVELKNVRGNDGWLHGKSTHIAFQRGDKYYLIDRTDLVDVVNDLVDINSSVGSRASDAKYGLYRRFRRNDLLTMIKFSDIKDFCKVYENVHNDKKQ